MTDESLLEVLREAAAAVRTALDALDDWGLAGTRPGQYRSDLAADAAGCRQTVCSCGVHHPIARLVVA